jgi:hypothetical protein
MTVQRRSSQPVRPGLGTRTEMHPSLCSNSGLLGKTRQRQTLGLHERLSVAFSPPKVSLQAAGPLASDPIHRRALAQEEDEIEDDLSDFKLYPIVSISFFFRF